MPAGWIILPWSAWVEGGPLFSALFLLPLPVVLLAVPQAWRDLRRLGRFRERQMFHGMGEIPEDLPEDFVQTIQRIRSERDSSNRPGPTANRDAILGRDFLRSTLTNPVRWVDRLSWRWWTPSQRLAAECLCRRWMEARLHRRAGLVAIPLTWAGAWLAFRDGSGAWIPAFIAPLAIALLGLVAWFSPFGGIGLIHLFPIRLHDVAILRWKNTVLRSIESLPWVVLGGAGCTWILGDPSWVGAAIGLQIALAPAALSPLATVYGVLNEAKARGLMAGFMKLVVAGACLVNMVGFILLLFPGFGAGFELILSGLNYAVLRLMIWRLDSCRIEPAPLQVIAD